MSYAPSALISQEWRCVNKLINILYMESKPECANNIPDLCFTFNIDLIHIVKVVPAIVSDYNYLEMTIYSLEEVKYM